MTRVVAAIAVLALLTAGCSESEPAAPGPAESVVQVSGLFCQSDAVGSGVLIGDMLVLTSAHVLAGAEGGLLARRPGSQPVPAVLVGFDPNRDLALLRTPGISGPSAVLGAARAGTEGVIGTVNNEGDLELLDFTVDRLVTANSGDIYEEGEVSRAALQLSAATLPGDSGGALFDSSDRVIGIVFAQSRQFDDVAYAVTSDEVTAFLQEVDTSTEVPAGRCR